MRLVSDTGVGSKDVDWPMAFSGLLNTGLDRNFGGYVSGYGKSFGVGERFVMGRRS